MQVSINNFRGVENTEFELGNVTIIGGDNGAGKTSIAQAIAAAITGESPISDLKKTDFKHLVKLGAETANAEVSNEAGKAVMVYPDGKGYTQGKSPRSSVYSAGIISPLDMKKTDAAECWITLLEAEPTPDDLKVALSGNKHVEEVLQLVKTRGWDVAEKVIKEDGAKHKGRWEKITNERYGTAKAESWKPANFEFTFSKSELAAKVEAAKIAYEESLKVTAIADDHKKQLQEQAAKLEELKAKVSAGLEKEVVLAASRNKALKAYQEAQNSANTLECPCCKKSLKLHNGILSEDVGEKTDITPIKADYDNATRAHNDIIKENSDLRASLSGAESAAKKLSEITENTGVSTEKAQSEYAETREKLAAFNAFHEAQAENAEVMWRIEVARILAPDGLRKTKAEEKIADFNSGLSNISEAAKWKQVKLDSDFAATYDSRPFAILSESEQYRVRATIQMAIAMRDGSDLLIFDRADLLTKQGRNGLFHACRSCGVKSLILMSYSNKEEMPNLSGENFSYWLEEGVLCE